MPPVRLADIPKGDFDIGPNDVVIMMDETGDEGLSLSGHPLFGIGGLVATGKQLHTLERYWKRIKA